MLIKVWPLSEALQCLDVCLPVYKCGKVTLTYLNLWMNLNSSNLYRLWFCYLLYISKARKRHLTCFPCHFNNLILLFSIEWRNLTRPTNEAVCFDSNWVGPVRRHLIWELFFLLCHQHSWDIQVGYSQKPNTAIIIWFLWRSKGGSEEWTLLFSCQTVCFYFYSYS